jgi:hypothetical protein
LFSPFGHQFQKLNASLLSDGISFKESFSHLQHFDYVFGDCLSEMGLGKNGLLCCFSEELMSEGLDQVKDVVELERRAVRSAG